MARGMGKRGLGTNGITHIGLLMSFQSAPSLPECMFCISVIIRDA